MADRSSFRPEDEAARILAAVVESSDDAIIVTDLDGTILTWNGGASHLYGYDAAEMLGRSIAVLVPETHRSEFFALVARLKAAEGVKDLETIRRTKSGGLVEVSVTMAPIVNADGVVIGATKVARNISARKLGELAQRSSEVRWRSVVDSAVDGIVVIDERGRIEAFNPAAEGLFGYQEAEVQGRNIKMLMPSPYHEEHDGYLARYIETHVKKIIGIGREVTGLRRDGTTFPLHLSVGEMSFGGERRFTGILHDLSDRVRLEERLRASEARWRAVVESAVDAIVVIDAKGCIEGFNPAAERLFGYSEDEVAGQNVNLLMPSPYHEEHDGYLARYLSTGVQKIIGIGREVTGRRKDGTTFPVHLSVGETALAGERKFTGILHDLSARVVMEEQLRERAALARLGEMAAVLAHEVKNPLAAVRGAIEVIGSRLPAGTRDAGVVKEIVSRIDSLNELMKDLLLFARPPRPHPLLVDISALVASTAELLTEDPSLNALRIEIEGAAPPVFADPGLLRIVFLNLMVNSAHAMRGQGHIKVLVEASDGVCRIAFEDSGPGIPPEIREKIFTPFFTTKSRGTGLGLPTAKRLVEAHRGTIDVRCPPGGGTTVTVQLPAH
jgi:two-component system sensor kinase FixL